MYSWHPIRKLYCSYRTQLESLGSQYHKVDPPFGTVSHSTPSTHTRWLEKRLPSMASEVIMEIRLRS